MKKLFTLLILLTTLTGFSQNFAPPGATWYYSYHFLSFIEGYVEIRYENDTIIQGIQTQKLRKTINAFDYINNEPINDLNDGFEYIYSDEDHVYQFIENDFLDDGFRLLYDFTVQVGDTVLIYNNDIYELNTDCDTVGYSVVTETGMEIINTMSLRWYRLENLPGSSYSFKGKIVERIGNTTNYMFSEVYCIITEEGRSPFRCYSDDNFAEYKNPEYEGECDFVVGISEITKNDLGLVVYPNPASESVNISVAERVKVALVRVYEVSGRMVLDQSPGQSPQPPFHPSGQAPRENAISLDISDLSPGMYLVEVETKDGLREVKRVLIE